MTAGKTAGDARAESGPSCFPNPFVIAKVSRSVRLQVPFRDARAMISAAGVTCETDEILNRE